MRIVTSSITALLLAGCAPAPSHADIASPPAYAGLVLAFDAAQSDGLGFLHPSQHFEIALDASGRAAVDADRRVTAFDSFALRDASGTYSAQIVCEPTYDARVVVRAIYSLRRRISDGACVVLASSIEYERGQDWVANRAEASAYDEGPCGPFANR